MHNAGAIFIDVAVGHMQDNEWLVFKFFDRGKWGRRAPWVILATPIMSLMSEYSLWSITLAEPKRAGAR